MANELLQQYEKEYSKVRRLINRLKKQGDLPQDYPLPHKDKRVTQDSLNRLRQIDKTVLLNEARRQKIKPTKAQLEEEYNKQLRRINNAIKREQNKGHDVSWLQIPSRPKRITKQSVAKLEKITSRYIKGNIPDVSSSKEIAIRQNTKPPQAVNYSETFSPSQQKFQEPTELEYESPQQPANMLTDETESVVSDDSSVKKPKQKSDAEKDAVTVDFYESSDKEKGIAEPPSEAIESIVNLVESLEGEDDWLAAKLYEDFSRKSYLDPEQSTSSSLSSLYYDVPNDESELNSILDKLNTWQPSPRWSTNLSNIKERDVQNAKDIVDYAIQLLGTEEVAKNVNDNSSELTEMINEIMYRGSGNDFIKGRDSISRNIVRLYEILTNRTLDFDENAKLLELMERREYYETPDANDYYSDVLE